VAALNRARRQLNLLQSQDLGQLEVRVILNRFEKSMSRTIRPSDVREALGRDVAYTIGNDFPMMRAAIERGVPIEEIKRKSAVGRDLDTLDAGLSATLGLDR
jgi:pilus assembly protein CpaE